MRSHPACHGMAVVVSPMSPVCQSCESRVGCVLKIREAVSALPDGAVTNVLRQHLALVSGVLLSAPSATGKGCVAKVVTASTRGVLRVELGQVELRHLAQLPDKVAGPVRALTSRGWFIFAKQELSQGRLPQSSGWKHTLLQAMLARASRVTFQRNLKTDLSLTDSSAKTQASLALSIFRAGGILSARDDRLSVSAD